MPAQNRSGSVPENTMEIVFKSVLFAATQNNWFSGKEYYCRWDNGEERLTESIHFSVKYIKDIATYIDERTDYDTTDQLLFGVSESGIRKYITPAIRLLESLRLAQFLSSEAAIKKRGAKTSGYRFRLINLPSQNFDECVAVLNKRRQDIEHWANVSLIARLLIGFGIRIALINKDLHSEAEKDRTSAFPRFRDNKYVEIVLEGSSNIYWSNFFIELRSNPSLFNDVPEFSVLKNPKTEKDHSFIKNIKDIKILQEAIAEVASLGFLYSHPNRAGELILTLRQLPIDDYKKAIQVFEHRQALHDAGKFVLEPIPEHELERLQFLGNSIWGTGTEGEIFIDSDNLSQLDVAPSPAPPIKNSNDTNAVSLLKIPNNLFRNNTKFIGRNDDLADLHSLINLESSVLQTISIVGMGGLGKSELCFQYAMRYGNNYPGGVCWIDLRGGSPKEDIVAFANIAGYNISSSSIDTDPRVIWKKWKKDKTLIIFDDIDSIEQVKSIIPAEPQFSILFTTRDKSLGDIIFPLKDLTDSEARELLATIISEKGVENEEEQAKKITDFMGNLAFGIELIGNHILYRRSRLESSISLKAVADELYSRRDNWKEDPGATMNYQGLEKQENILTTAQRGAREAFNLTWEFLSSSTQKVAKFTCPLPHSDVPWNIIEGAFDNIRINSDRSSTPSKNEIGQAKLDLLRFCLIKKKQSQYIESYYYHPLLKDFFRSKMSPNEIKIWGDLLTEGGDEYV